MTYNSGEVLGEFVDALEMKADSEFGTFLHMTNAGGHVRDISYVEFTDSDGAAWTVAVTPGPARQADEPASMAYIVAGNRVSWFSDRDFWGTVSSAESDTQVMVTWDGSDEPTGPYTTSQLVRERP